MSQEQDNINDTHTTRKLELEIKKLEKEISFLHKPFRNPANWAPLATIVAALSALLYGILSGWFVLQNDTIKNQNYLLEIRNDSLNQLNKQIKIREARVNSIQDSFEFMKSYVSNTQQEIFRLKQQDSILQRSVINGATKQGIINDLKNIIKQEYNPRYSFFYIKVIDSITDRPVVNAKVIFNNNQEQFTTEYTTNLTGYVRYSYDTVSSLPQSVKISKQGYCQTEIPLKQALSSFVVKLSRK